jgi:hypothetical protein
MEMVKHTLFLMMTATLTVQAADFSLGIGASSAAIAPGDTGNVGIKKLAIEKGGSMAVRAENCADPAKAQITGTAEGVVDGKRSSVPLTRLVAGTVPGAYIVYREWPAQGVWVVSLTGVCGAAKASAIVPFDPNGNYLRESSKFYPRAATRAEIEASLKTLTGGGK